MIAASTKKSVTSSASPIHERAGQPPSSQGSRGASGSAAAAHTEVSATRAAVQSAVMRWPAGECCARATAYDSLSSLLPSAGLSF